MSGVLMSRIHAQGFILAILLTLFLQPNVGDFNKDILCFLNVDISNYRKMGKCWHVLDLYRKSLLNINNEHGDAAPQSPHQGEGDYPKMRKCLHLLDLYRKCQLHTHNKPGDAAPRFPNQGPGKRKPKAKPRIGHSAVCPVTELHEAGVRFMKSESKSLRDITFDSGILKLPYFVIDDHTESIFLNLMAFERCHIPAGNDVSSFITFIDCIIDDSRDIKLLSSKGIIATLIRTDKEAANLFNTMSKDLVLGLNFKLLAVNDLVTHRNDNTSRVKKWLAEPRRTYLRSPWTIISVIAAFLLFCLTIVQTIFTIPN